MAIQTINLGSMPLGAGGDTQRAANEKINQNFSNQTHAASRLVGTGTGQIPTSEQVFEASGKTVATNFEGSSLKDLANGSKVAVPTSTHLSAEGEQLPDNASFTRYIVTQVAGDSSDNAGALQIAWPAHDHGATTYDNLSPVYIRIKNAWRGFGKWIAIGQTPATYTKTTAAGANVVVNSEGLLTRASSSLKYKDVISKLQLNDDLYRKVIGVNPIIYRSKSEIDPKNWHFMSFIAEELGELDPALTQWLITTHDDEGNELDEPVKEAEGINLNAICAVLHATNVYQDKKLKELEQRLTALESNNESKQ